MAERLSNRRLPLQTSVFTNGSGDRVNCQILWRSSVIGGLDGVRLPSVIGRTENLLSNPSHLLDIDATWSAMAVVPPINDHRLKVSGFKVDVNPATKIT